MNNAPDAKWWAAHLCMIAKCQEHASETRAFLIQQLDLLLQDAIASGVLQSVLQTCHVLVSRSKLSQNQLGSHPRCPGSPAQPEGPA